MSYLKGKIDVFGSLINGLKNPKKPLVLSCRKKIKLSIVKWGGGRIKLMKRGGRKKQANCIFFNSIKAIIKQWKSACSSLQFQLKVTLGMENSIPLSTACGMFKLL